MMSSHPKNSISNRFTPGSVALLYVAFAALWIIASSNLLTLAVEDAILQSRIELGKGLLFVAVTGGLLYLLLKGWRESLGGMPNHTSIDIQAPRTSRLMLLFAACVLVVPLVGVAIIRLYGPQVERDAYANLQAVANLKANQIDNWLDERNGDAMALAGGKDFVGRVGQFIRDQHDAGLTQSILERFANLRTGYGYDSILLFDNSGKLLLIHGEERDNTPVLQQQLRRAITSRQVQRGDLYRDQTGHVHLDWVVPIFVPGAQDAHSTGAVVLRITAQHFIFPLIQTWPTASASAESLLVRREGDEVLYLNELRHRKDTALALKLQLTATDLPAAIAVLKGKPGTVQGKDYRGVEVLAAYRPVTGTNWHIVAKIDREEILAPLRTMALLISVVVFFAFTVVSAVVILLWRQQQRTYTLALHAQSMAAIGESEQRYHTLADSGQALIWTAGTDKLCNYFNKIWLEFTGRTLQQELGNGWAEGVHPDDFQRCLEGYMSAFDRREKFSIDYRLRRHDGEYRWIQDDGSPRYDIAGEFIGYIGYCLDVTARKEDQAKIQRLTRFYATLSQCNQAIVRSTKAEELFPQICRDAVQYGGMKMAWIGLLDETDKQVRVEASYGDDHHYLDGIQISLDISDASGHGPTGSAIRENLPNWCQDFQHDPATAPWHERGARAGWGAAAALPLQREGVVIGALTLYAGEINAFDEEVRKLLIEMATDISFALDNFAREDRRTHAENEAALLTQRLSLANEASAIGIWDWDLNTDQWYATPTYFTMLGYSPEEGFADRKRWLERIHPDDRNAVAEKIRATLDGSGAPYEYEARMLDADGSYRWISVVGRVVMQDPTGKAIRMLGVRMDISERKQTETKLAEQLEELRRWHEVTSGREERVLELKQEVNELLVQTGKPPRYPSAESQAD